MIDFKLINDCGGRYGMPDSAGIMAVKEAAGGRISLDVLETWSLINGLVVGNYAICSYSDRGITTNCCKGLAWMCHEWLEIGHNYGGAKYMVPINCDIESVVYYTDSEDGWKEGMVVASSIGKLIQGMCLDVRDGNSGWPYNEAFMLQLDPDLKGVSGRKLWDK